MWKQAECKHQPRSYTFTSFERLLTPTSEGSAHRSPAWLQNHLSRTSRFPGWEKSHMELYKNNKHVQGFSKKKKSATRWGSSSFLDAETDFEEKGEVGSTLKEQRSPSSTGRAVGRAVNLGTPWSCKCWCHHVTSSSTGASPALTSSPLVPSTMSRPPKCAPADHQPPTRLQPIIHPSQGLMLLLHATHYHQDKYLGLLLNSISLLNSKICTGTGPCLYLQSLPETWENGSFVNICRLLK